MGRKPNFNVCTPVHKVVSGKQTTTWYRIGAAWNGVSTGGKDFISVKVDLPVQNGVILLWPTGHGHGPPRGFDDAPHPADGAAGDDDIPF